MSELKLFLLGKPQVERQKKPLPLKRRKAVALLAYLAMTDQPHTREAVATMFWPDYDASRGRAYLRRELAAINEALGPGWLLADREQVAFQSQANFWLDARQFQQLTAAGATTVDLASLQQAVALYRGDFLAGFTLPDAPDFDEWQFFQAESLRQQLAQTLERLIDGLSQQSDFEGIIPHARRWLALDSLHEPAHRRLMQLYHQAGQPAAALRQYEACVQILDEELGVPPETETTTLYEAIKAQRLVAPLLAEPAASTEKTPPSPAKAAVPAHLSTPPASNLPHQSTPFIGRQKELTQLKRLLQEEAACRLLTIVGPGGMGKTRLALQTAENCQTAYADGVYFVPLAPVSETAFLIPAILEALNLPSASGTDPLAQLGDYLRPRQMLLLLDNFEHLLDGADLLAAIIVAAPQVQLLVTSRERLNLPGEWGFDLEGLQLLPPGTAALDDLPKSDAANLFLQSAKRAKANFAPTAADVPHIIRICQAVGGMPLGLELAAPWIRLMSCQEIASEIEANLDFLSTSQRQLPARHRSLRAVFDYSWQQLSDEEQSVFSKLWVFRGGYTREAAQAVAGASLQTLLQLVDKSLLRRTSTGRYEVHELLRQYGEAALIASPTEQTQIQEDHCQYYLTWLGQRQAELQGAGIKDALEMIALEFDNIKAAWHYATNSKNAPRLDQAFEALFWFVECRGRFQEGQILFQHTIETLSDLASAPDQETARAYQLITGHVLGGQGWLLTRLGMPEASQASYERGLSLLEALRPAAEKAFAFAHVFHGVAFYIWQQYDVAQSHLQMSYDLCQTVNDRWGMALALLIRGLSIAEHQKCPSEAARSLLAQAIALYNEIGERRNITYGLGISGQQALWQGHYQQAQEYFWQVYQTRRELGDQISLGFSYEDLGEWAYHVGQYDEAETYLEQALAIHRDVGNRLDAFNPNRLGTLARLRGNLAQAATYHQQALTFARQANVTMFIGESLEGLGCVAYEQRDYAQATHYLQESLAIWQEQQAKGRLASTLRHLGHVAADNEQRSEAIGYYRQALSITIETQIASATLDILRGVAELLIRDEAHEQAIELLALAQHHSASTYETKEKAKARLTELATDLPGDLVDAATKRGQALDWQTAANNSLEMFAKWEGAEIGPLMAPTQRFVPESLIGTGEIGEVYQGRDTETGRRVAIKRLKPELTAENPELVKRLVREGEDLRRLNHPNIVHMLAMVEDEHQPLIVMEYVSGGSLRDRLKQEPQLPLNYILDLSLELADALTRAHHLGILHRDIKPANVLLAEDGSPRLTDFGVAHFSGQETHLTQTGAILGTVAYLSPEACRGEVLDTRSDIWSFGVMLFEMLTGRALFEKQHIAATLTAILGEPIPDLAEIRSDLPLALIELVKQMLVKDQEHRIGSMRQVAAALEIARKNCLRAPE